MEKVDSLIISIDFSNGGDADVLIVGRKQPNRVAEIINAFQGSEARELYEKIITKKEK